MENRPLSEIVAELKARRDEFESADAVGKPFNASRYNRTLAALKESLWRNHEDILEALPLLLAERERYREALVMMYRKDCGLVADACDEIIDKSGALLGEIRKAALNRDTEAHDAAKKD